MLLPVIGQYLRYKSKNTHPYEPTTYLNQIKSNKTTTKHTPAYTRHVQLKIRPFVVYGRCCVYRRGCRNGNRILVGYTREFGRLSEKRRTSEAAWGGVDAASVEGMPGCILYGLKVCTMCKFSGEPLLYYYISPIYAVFLLSFTVCFTLCFSFLNRPNSTT